MNVRELKASPLQILRRLGVDWAEQDLYQELVAKERVIQELLVYRKSSLHYLFLDRFLGRLGPRGWSYWNCFDRATYPPRPLRASGPVPPPPSVPSIALVTPSYQQVSFLESTIQSVISQGYPRLQYWIQDGGSTDGSIELIERYQEHLTGWETATDSGQTQAINRGFTKVRGDLMGWLNSDDLHLPGTLCSVADYFQRNPEVDVVYGHRILVNSLGQDIGRWIMPPHVDDILSWCDLIP